MISYDFMWCSCISFLSFAFFLPFWPGLTVGRFGCEPFCRTQSALLQGPAPGQGPNRSPFAGPLQPCCLEALSQDQPFGQPFLKTFSPQASAAGSRCWPATPLPPLQAQVSWPALQAVALCFLPVAGGSLSSFGTGLARFLAAGLASFGAAASFGSGAAASFGSVAGRPAGLASLAGFPNLAHVLQKQWV